MANTFISQINTQTMQVKLMVHNHIAMIILKHYTLAGFEPGPSVTESFLNFQLGSSPSTLDSGVGGSPTVHSNSLLPTFRRQGSMQSR
jgi:hypothetical protein